MARWLVTLALFVVSNPADADQYRVELSNQKVTTSKAALAQLCEPQLARLPASVQLEADDLMVAAGDRTIRHALSHGGAGPVWMLPIGSRLLVGAADRAHDQADTLLAIDLATGAVAWRRQLDSVFAAELAGDLLAVERNGALDVVDVRTGKTIATTPLTGQGIQAVCRPTGATGDLHVKTRGDLIAITRTGAIRWVRTSTAHGNVAVTQGAVVDGWVDRTNHRFGIVSYDPTDGRRISSVDLGSTGGWYDFDRLVLAPDGPREVMVSALFAVE
jgi:PQQ-like domain